MSNVTGTVEAVGKEVKGPFKNGSFLHSFKVGDTWYSLFSKFDNPAVERGNVVTFDSETKVNNGYTSNVVNPKTLKVTQKSNGGSATPVRNSRTANTQTNDARQIAIMRQTAAKVAVELAAKTNSDLTTAAAVTTQLAEKIFLPYFMEGKVLEGTGPAPEATEVTSDEFDED